MLNDAEATNNLNTLFPSMEAENKEYTEFDQPDFVTEYEENRLTLKDLEINDQYTGEPILSEVYSYDFTDKATGKTETKNKCKLWLVDHENEEYLEISINLKYSTDIQKDIHFKSTIYKLIGGIMERNSPGWKKANNHIRTFDLSDLRTYLNSLNSMTVLAYEEHDKMEYMSFKVLDFN